MGQHGTDHALIGGVVAVVVFVTLCLIIVLGRYLARHKGKTTAEREGGGGQGSLSGLVEQVEHVVPFPLDLRVLSTQTPKVHAVQHARNVKEGADFDSAR